MNGLHLVYGVFQRIAAKHVLIDEGKNILNSGRVGRDIERVKRNEHTNGEGKVDTDICQHKFHLPL